MSTRTHGGVALFLLGSLVCLSLPPPAHAQFNCGSLVQEPSYVSRSDINQLGLTITIRNQFGVPQPGCPLQLTLLSVVNSYGHQHSGGRPVGSLTPSTCNTGANGLGCNTIWGSPEVSGQIVLRLSANPPGATCSNGFPINTTDFAMCVQIDGLVDLGTGTGHSLTGQTATHPVNHYATPEMKSALQALAMKFSAETGLTLGINDISLIKGGIFDYKPSTNPWMPPHASHRLGVDADIDLMPPAQRRRFLNMLAEVNPNLVRIREPGTLTHYHLRLK